MYYTCTRCAHAMQLVDEGADTNKLWMGDLEPFMDEQFLTSAFTQFGYHVQSIRWIRNYQTGLVARYCFVEFSDGNAARQALEMLNSQLIPGTNGSKRFKLNWANRKVDSGQTDYNVFVADLSRDVTSQQLLEFFQQRFKSIRYAKVVEDDDGVSKGYGFVRFMDERERDLCLVEMAGAIGLGRKALTIKHALAPKCKPPMMPVSDGSPSVPTGYSCPPAGCQPWPTPSVIPVQSVAPYLTQVHQMVPLAPPVQAVGSYIEDLVDPSPPLELEKVNCHVLRQQSELFLVLESCRWQTPPDTRAL